MTWTLCSLSGVRSCPGPATGPDPPRSAGPGRDHGRPTRGTPTTNATRYRGEGVIVTEEASRLGTGELQPVVTAAIARWAATGLSAEQVAVLSAVPVRVEDMGGQGDLGLTVAV